MQLEFFDVPSPCVGVCQSNEKGLCLGCMRNRDERLQWNTFHSDEKQKVIKRCQQRLKRKKLANDKASVDKAEKVENIEKNLVNQAIEVIQPSLLDPPVRKVTGQSLNTDISQDDFGDFEL